MEAEVVTLSIADLAEQLASYEDAGYNRALTDASLSDIQRWELMQEHNRNHDLRVRLYLARMKLERAA